MRRLREHSQVSVALPRGTPGVRADSLQCDVVALLNSVAVLYAVDRSLARRLPDEVTGAFLGFQHEGALVALQGILTRRDDLLRFRVSDGIQLPRRESTRVPVSAPVTLKSQRTGDRADGVTLNIGVDGLLAECDLAVVEGDDVVVVLSLPGIDEEVECAGEVIRAEAGEVGLTLREGSRTQRRLLWTFVVEQSFAELRRQQLDSAGVGLDDEDL